MTDLGESGKSFQSGCAWTLRHASQFFFKDPNLITWWWFVTQNHLGMSHWKQFRTEFRQSCSSGPPVLCVLDVLEHTWSKWVCHFQSSAELDDELIISWTSLHLWWAEVKQNGKRSKEVFALNATRKGNSNFCYFLLPTLNSKRGLEWFFTFIKCVTTQPGCSIFSNVHRLKSSAEPLWIFFWVSPLAFHF